MTLILKFLNSYTKEDRACFFGRVLQIDDLYNKVKGNAITLFYGLSGTGKTSVIMCGLCNRFDDADWMSFVIRRGNERNILAATVSALMSVATAGGDALSQLREIYYTNFRPIYLIFDQLEEMFIYGDKAEKTAFIHFLKAIKEDCPFVKAILVIREEFFVHLDDFETDIPEIFKSRVRLEPVSKTEAEDIIVQICKVIKLRPDKEVIAEIIQRITVRPRRFVADNNFEVMERKIELSYLQVYLQEILDMNSGKPREHDGFLNLSVIDLPALGCANDVLADHLDNCISAVCKKVNNGVVHADKNMILKVIGSLVSYKGTKQKKHIQDIVKTVSYES